MVEAIELLLYLCGLVEMIVSSVQYTTPFSILFASVVEKKAQETNNPKKMIKLETK